jgi:hypothetical protein
MTASVSQTVTSPSTPEKVVNSWEADRLFVQQMLASIRDQGGDSLTTEALWNDAGKTILQHWSALNLKQSPFSTFNMLLRCAEMALKVKVLHQKSPLSANTDMLAEYDAMMQHVFAPSSEQEE